MKPSALKEIRDKSRLMYGLLTVLKDEVDVLRYDANNGDIPHLLKSSNDVHITIEKLDNLIEEIEYILYLNAY